MKKKVDNKPLINLVGKLIMAHTLVRDNNQEIDDIYESQLIDLHDKTIIACASPKYRKIAARLIVAHYFFPEKKYRNELMTILQELNPNNEDDNSILQIIFDEYPEYKGTKTPKKAEKEEEIELEEDVFEL